MGRLKSQSQVPMSSGGRGGGGCAPEECGVGRASTESAMPYFLISETPGCSLYYYICLLKICLDDCIIEVYVRSWREAHDVY